MTKTTTRSRGARKRAPRRSAAEWAEEVASWKRSGETSREYARARGIAASTLSWWSRRGDAGVEVTREPQSAPPSTRASRSRRSTGTGHEGRRAVSAFLSVRPLIADHDSPPPSVPRLEAEIVLLGGRRVRVAGAMTIAELGRLLDAVEGGAAC